MARKFGPGDKLYEVHTRFPTGQEYRETRSLNRAQTMAASMAKRGHESSIVLVEYGKPSKTIQRFCGAVAENPLSSTTESVLIALGIAGVVGVGYLLLAKKASASPTGTTGGGAPASPQPYLITVPMSSATDPAISVPSGAIIQVNEPSGGTGGFPSGFASAPTTAGTDASGNILLDYTVTAPSGTSGSYAWTSADGSVVYSIPINVT